MAALRARRAAVALQSRLLLLTALVLGTCLGAAGWVLDRSFKATVRAAAAEQLQATAHGVLGAADERGSEIVFATTLAEPRLSQPQSGLYAFVQDAGGDVLWRSPSAAASGVEPPTFPQLRRPAPGESVFAKQSATHFALGYTVVWESLGTQMTIWVVADWTPYRGRILAFRRNVAIGLTGAALFFLFVQLAAVRLGLAPLRRMVARIRRLEAGEATDIGQDYPPELSGLARTLNRFIAYERDNRERYRHAMDNLAHSLKTPLAVLKNAAREQRGDDADLVREQVTRMETTVAHQLSRAAAARLALPVRPLALLPTAARVTRALRHAYAEKAVTVDAPWEADQPEPNAYAVRVDERDALEMLGNLIENAFKYTRSRVRISAALTPGGVATTVEDDGDGIPESMREQVLRRGVRADTATTGQGIGLAVVVEIATSYGGRLEIASSDLGGAAVRLELPGGRGVGGPG